MGLKQLDLTFELKGGTSHSKGIGGQGIAAKRDKKAIMSKVRQDDSPSPAFLDFGECSFALCHFLFDWTGCSGSAFIRLALHSLPAFPHNKRNQAERGNRIGPPHMPNRVYSQSHQSDHRKIPA